MNSTSLFFLFSFSSTWILQGLQHPLFAPTHIILIFGLAFLIAQHQSIVKHILMLIFALICGMLTNHFVDSNFDLKPIILGFALFIGLLVALRWKQQPQMMLMLSLVISLITGFLLGVDSTPLSLPGLSNGISNWYIGAFISISLSALILSLIATVLNRFLDGIILRVLGSWVATSALITLTLQLAKT